MLVDFKFNNFILNLFEQLTMPMPMFKKCNEI